MDAANDTDLRRGGDDDTSVQSEIQEFLALRQQRWRVFPHAALVGLCSGAVAILFRTVLGGAEVLRAAMLAWAHRFPSLGWVFPVLWTTVAAAVSVAAVRHWAPDAAGSGIPHLESVLRRFRSLAWKRILPVKFLGGAIAIGGGLALGREGPTVQMGGAIGAALADGLRASEHERLTLIAAGAGAGLAAAFNAPLAGLVFVLEEIRGDFHLIVFGAAFIASAVGDIIARLWMGQVPVFSAPSYPTPPLASLPIFALLGVLAGLLGVLFNRGLLATISAYARLPARLVLAAAALTGSIIGLVGWFSPTVIGSGHALAETALQGEVSLAAIPGLLAVRFLLTAASYATGAPGGIFAPLLVLGALLGLAVGQIGGQMAPTAVPVPATFAVVGMAACFTGIVRAPLTAVVLIVEMTGNYDQMLPLLVSCFAAYAIGEILRDTPIYEALLERDLRRTRQGHFLRQPIVVDFTIAPGAPFVGCEVRALGLPAGCVLVRCRDGKREWVPRANTRLEPHWQITAVVEPEAADGIEILRSGCGSRTASGPETETS